MNIYTFQISKKIQKLIQNSEKFYLYMRLLGILEVLVFLNLGGKHRSVCFITFLSVTFLDFIIHIKKS